MLTIAEAEYMIIFVVGDASAEALGWNNFIKVLSKVQIVILVPFQFASLCGGKYPIWHTVYDLLNPNYYWDM